MSLKKFLRNDVLKRDELPKVGIRDRHFAFNAVFIKHAELNKYSEVTLLIDEESYGLGFQFHNNKEDKNSYKLRRNGGSPKMPISSLLISSNQIMKVYPWIKNVSKLKSPLDKQFKVEFDIREKAWMIYLCPAFEIKASNKSQLKDVVGIYRYKLEDQIVYIGKGKIKSRINSPERDSWEFDTIEYSILENLDSQSKWESYWLDRFVEEYGRLPIYNKISAPKTSLRKTKSSF